MFDIGNIKNSLYKTLTGTPAVNGLGFVANSLGAPGDVYLVTDTRKNPRKELDQMRSLQRYNIEPYTPETAFASESGTVLFPVKDLHFDRKNFQNRETDFSDESVLKIIKAVKDGKFNWAVFDAITIWQNPADGKFYVLSGHSRSEAFKRLAEMGESADGKNFTKIPAKIFKGTLDEARDLALNSNTLSTKETNFERANYYRSLYNSEIAKGRSKAEATNLIMPIIKEREGKNANSIFYISFLNPTGIFYDSLRQLQNAPTQDRERLKVVGEWVGRLRKDRSKLTDFHERELFDYLITQGNYNKTVTNYADLLKRIDTALLKMVDDKGNFQPERSLNLKKNIVAEGNEKAFLQELDRLKRVAADDENLYNQKLAEFRNRQKIDSTITDDQILKAVEPYRQRAILSKADYNAFRQKRAQYIDADRRQTSLFGLGKPTIKFEFEDNADLFNFFAKKNDYSNAQNVDFENVAALTASNGKRGASRTHSAITTPDTLYLPYSAGSKALPGSANPKSLPPSNSPKQLPPSYSQKALPAYANINEEGLLPGFIENRNILQNSGMIPVTDIISVVKQNPSQIFVAAGTNGIKKYKFKGKEDSKFVFESVDDNGKPITGEINVKFIPFDIERLNNLKSWFIAPERTAPDWDAIYKTLKDSHHWNSFDPESAAEYDVKIFRNAYNNVIAELPENRKNDFTQKFISKVYEIARLNAAAPSAAVTGRGGITAKKAAKYNAANDRYMQARADFSEWLNNYAERAAKIEDRERKAAMNVEERRDERFEVIKKDIDYFSALLKNRAQVPSYRISNARQNLQSKLETEAYKGNVETITKLLEYMRPLNVFTNRSSVWQLADLAKRRRAKYQQAEKAFEAQNADENADYKIEFDENEDRVKIYFNGIPSENIRTWLKQHNFRWSPRNKAWQRQITVDSRRVVNQFNSMMKSGELSGLGKPTVKFEFENNNEIFKTFGSGVSGLTVNDKPAALFNCPESMLQCKGFIPTYTRLEDYSSLIEPATGEKKLVGYGFEVATLNELANACNSYKQVEKLAKWLKATTPLQSAFNVWHWLHTNIYYNYDTPGEEEIRTPARTWADRERGVDCDCLAVFTACLLGAMGYKPKFEIVGFNNSPKFSHIYVNLDGAAIDRVLPVFLARPQNITKTKIMEIPVFELSGTAEADFATLNGIYADTLLKVNNNTATAQDSMDLRKSQYLLALQKNDPYAYKLAAMLMPYVVAIDDNGSFYFANNNIADFAENADKKLYALKVSGANETAFNDFFNDIVGDFKNLSVRLERKDGKTVVSISFTNPANENYIVSGEYIKKDLLALNPEFSAMREALKNLIAVNFYGIATRFALGLTTSETAIRLGYSLQAWQKATEAIAKLKKLWTLIGGAEDSLLKIITSGAEKEPVYEVDTDTSIIDLSAFDSVLHGLKLDACSGINGLGEVATVGSSIETLGIGFEKIWQWVDEIEPGEMLTNSQLPQSAEQQNIRFAAPLQSNNSNEARNIALLLLGGAVLGGGIAAVSNNNKKTKKR